jgi:hypothetical protein
MRRVTPWFCAISSAVLVHSTTAFGAAVDFQREIRPILSQNCFLCHGPDEKDRKAGLRLDIRTEALKPAKSGQKAIVPGQPEKSELIARITHSDQDERMPPTKSGKKLSEREIDLFRRWIADGAPYANHWAYVKPERPPLPRVKHKDWVRNGIDYFIVDRLEHEGLEPAPEADRHTLIRRVSLDLTGLPPTSAEVNAFLSDPRSDAYETLVDRLLDRQSFGEYWARMWLDLARYADSAGYADDPLRTIWGYRDYVIDAFNKNKPFDQFTIEQIAGDLLPDPTEEQLVATAFHRNTMTNSEGGTNDEEFRSAAIVDRVNTTMTVWMGTSIACAQCHTHKYDPITQEEYFKFYALLNNTEDADRPDEGPTLKLFTKQQKKQRTEWDTEITVLNKKLSTSTPELTKGFEKWDSDFPRTAQWQTLKPAKATYKRELAAEIKGETVSVKDGPASETYSLEFPIEAKPFTALRLQIIGDKKDDSLLTRVSATVIPPKSTVGGRFVRIEIPGKEKILSLAEVQVFSGRENIAATGEATQSSTDLDSPAKLAIDGNTEGDFKTKSVTHTKASENPWWELDLKATQEINRLVIWNRTDSSLQKRLTDFRIILLNDMHQPVWERDIKEPPNPTLALTVDPARVLKFVGAYSESSVPKTDAAHLLSEKSDPKKGWAPASPDDGAATLLLDKAFLPESGSKLILTIERSSPNEQKMSFRIALSDDSKLPAYARVNSSTLALLSGCACTRSEDDTKNLTEYYLRNIAPELQPERDQLADLKKKIDSMQPYTVPVMHELTGDARRKTHLQYRGNFADLGKEVQEGVPAAFNPLPKDLPADRLALAKWLVDPNNPLTARVIVNRFWEQIFGIGIVRTAEEFGSQGELPTHPELLDYLATEFMAQKWDMKRFLKMLVTSAAYRQSSRVTPELAERDPDNRLLARGPRFRLPAESVRDQALFVAGLLSPKIKGPSVRPMRPTSGLSAAFGSSVDWKTSEGEDRFRRALYTEWRRTSPYPSMTTFDAPNREVCTIRRNRTNTPLQALVTLNDPVYIEAAQGLARRMMKEGSSVSDRIRRGFEICLSREPNEKEINRLAVLFGESLTDYGKSPEKSKQMASLDGKDQPEVVELAAWTTVANVLLNLDETLMKR